MSHLFGDLMDRFGAVAPGGFRLNQDKDAKGVASLWCELAHKDDLLAVGQVIKAIGGRLLTISVFQPVPPETDEAPPAEGEAKPAPASLGGLPIDGKSYEIGYHFDLDGATLTIQVFLPAEDASIPSLTPLFRNANWPERDFMENYSIRVDGHPDPRRLFIDPSIEPGALERLIPFTTLVNAASTKALWEKITASKTGAAS